MSLRVGLTDWIAYAPFYLGRDLGYYDGCDIEFKFKLDSRLRYDLFRKGQLDCIATSINAFSREAPSCDGRIVLALVEIKQPGSERIVAKSSFNSLEDLQQATICFVPDGLEHFYFRYFFDQAGVPFPEHILEATSREEMRELFRLGRADAVILYEPFINAFTSKAEFHVIPNNADLSVVIAVLVVDRDTAERQEKQLRALIDGYFRALTYLKDFPDQALTRLLRYFRASIDQPLDDLQEKFTGFRYLDQEQNFQLFVHPEETLCRAIETSVNVWREIGSLNGSLDVSRLIEPAFVSGLEK